MIGLVIALAASASGAPSQPAVAPSARWEFRVCTFRALDVRLRKIYISPTHDGLIEEVFQDCATELAELRRVQPASDVEELLVQQSKRLREYEQTFYWDNMTGRV